MKNKIKICICILVALLTITGTQVQAATGYTYDHRGDAIYSTEGLTVNETPYLASTLGLNPDDLNSPSDLFVYKDDEGTLIYLLDDSKDTLFVFNDQFQLLQRVSHLRYNPNELYATDPSLVQTKTSNESSKPTGLIGDADVLNLNTPSGIHRAVNPNTKEDLIYICDKGNHQIVVFKADSYQEENPETKEGSYQVYQVVSAPLEQLGKNTFDPKEVLSDSAGRIYVIADKINDGIMQFSKEGQFNSYTGVNYVTLSAWDIFWRNFATQAQREKMTTLYNTSFTDMVYKDHMLYTTSYAISVTKEVNDGIMIKKINPSGKDVLRRNGYNAPKGDNKYIKTDDGKGTYGPSKLESVTVNEYGVYTVVDSNRGRLFTYDNEGNLLYISGERGDLIDKISNPVAVQYLGEDLLVLDKNRRAIIKFEPTKIGSLINRAVEQEYNGRTTREEPKVNTRTKTWWIGKEDTKIAFSEQEFYEQDGTWWIGDTNTGIEAEELAAVDYWEQVVKLNANYEYAYIGIGKMYQNRGEYKQAMKYFKLGADRYYYGKAFKQYRDAKIRKYFGPVVITVAVLIVGGVVFSAVRRKKLGIKREEETGIGDE